MNNPMLCLMGFLCLFTAILCGYVMPNPTFDVGMLSFFSGAFFAMIK